MGMFKDMRDLRKASKDFERPGLRDSLKQANEAVQAYQAGQKQAVDLAVDVNGFQSEVTHTEPVSPLLIARLTPGAEITVKVDPQTTPAWS